ncbi:MAG TPA: hypothetical protein VJL54_07645 [Nitrososphaera sp.]|nr:hypothetical protein [Nitrososphaera sp.]
MSHIGKLSSEYFESENEQIQELAFAGVSYERTALKFEGKDGSTFVDVEKAPRKSVLIGQRTAQIRRRMRSYWDMD